MGVSPVMAMGSQLTENWAGLPSARNSYAVRTVGSPGSMPRRRAMRSGAGVRASEADSQVPLLPTSYMSARKGLPPRRSRCRERIIRRRSRGGAT